MPRRSKAEEATTPTPSDTMTDATVRKTPKITKSTRPSREELSSLLPTVAGMAANEAAKACGYFTISEKDGQIEERALPSDILEWQGAILALSGLNFAPVAAAARVRKNRKPLVKVSSTGSFTVGARHVEAAGWPVGAKIRVIVEDGQIRAMLDDAVGKPTAQQEAQATAYEEEESELDDL